MSIERRTWNSSKRNLSFIFLYVDLKLRKGNDETVRIVSGSSPFPLFFISFSCLLYVSKMMVRDSKNPSHSIGLNCAMLRRKFSILKMNIFKSLRYTLKNIAQLHFPSWECRPFSLHIYESLKTKFEDEEKRRKEEKIKFLVVASFLVRYCMCVIFSRYMSPKISCCCHLNVQLSHAHEECYMYILWYHHVAQTRTSEWCKHFWLNFQAILRVNDGIAVNDAWFLV